VAGVVVAAIEHRAGTAAGLGEVTTQWRSPRIAVH